MKLASRLSALYAVLLGVTVLIVILASSIALVFELWRFSGDVMVAKHEEARILVDQYRREGMTLEKAAPEIVNALSGIGLRVTVYDLKGRYLAGDKTLRPKSLAGVLAAGGMQHFIPPYRSSHDTVHMILAGRFHRCRRIRRGSSPSRSPTSRAATSDLVRRSRCCSSPSCHTGASC